MMNNEQLNAPVVKKYPDNVTPEYVLSLTAPTKEFLCPMSANTFGIRFGLFKIRDPDTNTTIFEIENEEEISEEEYKQIDMMDDDEFRIIRYSFSPEFLKLKAIGTTLEFKVGPTPVKNFRMIERHYFGTKLIKSYDFLCNFCMPNSQNTWESIYSMPHLSEQEFNDIVSHPYETKSDSFYFVQDKLIMHHKAEYDYSGQNQ